jgi:hypothetical protein
MRRISVPASDGLWHFDPHYPDKKPDFDPICALYWSLKTRSYPALSDVEVDRNFHKTRSHTSYFQVADYPPGHFVDHVSSSYQIAT